MLGSAVQPSFLANTLLINPALVSLVALWLLSKARFQTPQLRKSIARTALICVVLIPLFEWFSPSFSVTILPAYTAVKSLAQALSISIGFISLLLLLYAAVSAVLFLRLVFDMDALVKLSGSARPLDHDGFSEKLVSRLKSCHRPVSLRINEQISSPVVWGWQQPVVLLPAGFFELPEEKQLQMVDHELEHVRRNDWLLLVVGRICCCLFWHIPWVWQLHRALQEAAENVCDDAVLGAGHAPHCYAETLVEGVKQERLKSITLAFSRKPFLFRRTEAVLDRFADREKLSANHHLLILTAGLLMTYAVSLVELSMFDVSREHRAPAFLSINDNGAIAVPEKSPLEDQGISFQDLRQLAAVPSLPDRLGIVFADQQYAPPLPNGEPYSFLIDPEHISVPSLAGSPLPAYLRIRAVKTVLPVYPSKAIARGREGQVTVSFSVMTDGAVVNAVVDKAEPRGYFEQVSIEAIQQFRFVATTVGQERNAERYSRTFVFKLPLCRSHQRIGGDLSTESVRT